MPTPTVTDTAHADGRTKRGPKAVASREYAAGGTGIGGFLPWSVYQQASATLPFYVDDITRDFGADLYERMLFDPQVSSSLESLILSVLSGGLHFSPAVETRFGEAESEDAKQSRDIMEFCRQNLDGLEESFCSVTLYEMLRGLAYGNKVAELVWWDYSDSPIPGKLALKAVKVKPRTSVAFVVDAMMNLLGYVAAKPQYGQYVAVGQWGLKPEDILPKSKFLRLTYQPKNGDPRGSSILRPAYNAWWLKIQTWPEYLKYITQFGSPSLVAENANAEAQTPATYKRDASGEIEYDENDLPVEEKFVDTLLASILAFRSGTGLVMPPGWVLKAIEMQGNGEAFQKFVDFLNREITLAIQCQTRAIMESEHGSRADSQTAQDVMGQVIRYLKTITQDMVMSLCRVMIRYNQGPEFERLCPKISLGDTNPEDVSKEMAAASQAGYTLDPSQFRGLDAKYGMPERSEASIKAAVERSLNPPDPAPVPGKTPQGGSNPTSQKESK